MIKKIKKEQIPECVSVIRESFGVIARQFHITEENAPRYVAFATSEERLLSQYEEKRPMVCYENEEHKIIGYYSLWKLPSGECELNNLCVLPNYQHQGIGRTLVGDAFKRAGELGYDKMLIGIIEENVLLRKWYESLGFVHIGTRQFDFFPFTSGYLVKDLSRRG